MALVMGVASTAMSATGKPFILGKGNAASTASKLTANVAAPALTLVNNGTQAAATALNLTVAPGKAPLTVNDAAGTGTGLSADELGGRDAAAFADSVHKHGGGDVDSGTVAAERVDDAIARDAEVVETVKSGHGAGSELDADTVDGKDSSEMVPKLLARRDPAPDTFATALAATGQPQRVTGFNFTAPSDGFLVVSSSVTVKNTSLSSPVSFEAETVLDNRRSDANGDTLRVVLSNVPAIAVGPEGLEDFSQTTAARITEGSHTIDKLVTEHNGRGWIYSNNNMSVLFFPESGNGSFVDAY